MLFCFSNEIVDLGKCCEEGVVGVSVEVGEGSGHGVSLQFAAGNGKLPQDDIFLSTCRLVGLKTGEIIRVMLSPYISGRTGVFIDEANLFHSQRTLGWKIDYKSLFWLLYDEYAQTKNIFLYTSFISTDLKKHSFINKLVDYGFVVHSKETKKIISTSGTTLLKGNLDIELALDAHRFSDTYDTLILFSGDSDFAYLVDLLKEAGKKVIVVSNKGHISRELLRRSEFVDLSSLRSKIEFIKHKTTSKEVVLDGITSRSIPK